MGRPFPTPPSGHDAAVRERSSTYKPSPLASNDSFSDFHSSPTKQLSDEEPSFLADLSKSRNIPNKSAVPAGNDSDFWEDSLASQRLPATKADEASADTEDLSLHETSVETSTTSMMDTPLPRHYQRKPAIVQSALSGPETRIPSLTRSEVSGTDQEATTPESHDRILNTTLPVQDVTEASKSSGDPVDFSNLDQTQQAECPNAKSTPASSQTVTPAVMRFMDTPDTAVRAAATPFGVGAALRDVTRKHGNNAVPSTPFTPSIDYHKTPRAALDDAERRKNHVLSVLASSTLPSRVKRFTPHPRRHVSMGPGAESISEEASFLGKLDESRSINESFISVASSQDLTPDRRGSRAFNQRANTSVPNILYSGAAASSPVSHLDSRPDTVKIQKHLNMMNQQLLDNNADLAREAEEWRNECTRLIGIMRETGIQIDDDGNVLGELPRLPVDEDSHEQPPKVGHSCPDEKAATQGVEELQALLHDKEEEIAELLNATSADEQKTLREELEESRRAHDALKAEFAQKTKDHTSQFTEICTEFEAQVGQLEARVHELEDELERSRAATDSDMRNQQRAEIASLLGQIQNLETNLAKSTNVIAELRAEAEGRNRELQERQDEASELHERLAQIDRTNEATAQALEVSEKACAVAIAERDSARQDAEESHRRLSDLERTLITNKAIMEEQRESLSSLEDLADREHKDLEETQRLLRDARKELGEVHSKLLDKDQEIEALRGQAELAILEKSACLEGSRTTEAENSVVGALEDRLEAAYKEIGRLKHEALTSPIRQSTLEARDARISALETEKLALMERLKAQEVSSPARWSNSMMTSTPLHKTVTSLKYPATPGPLKDVSEL